MFFFLPAKSFFHINAGEARLNSFSLNRQLLHVYTETSKYTFLICPEISRQKCLNLIRNLTFIIPAPLRVYT